MDVGQVELGMQRLQEFWAKQMLNLLLLALFCTKTKSMIIRKQDRDLNSF